MRDFLFVAIAPAAYDQKSSEQRYLKIKLEFKLMVQVLQKLKDNETIVYQLQQLVSSAVKKIFDVEIKPFDVDISQTVDKRLGDYACNIALKLTKDLQKNPRDISSAIAEELHASNIERVEVAGPGFINITLSNSYYLESLNTILSNGTKYGIWNLENDQVMYEFGQPNTHKAFHVGHLKSAITGLALARLTANLGYSVIQANYFGDVGMHVAKCVWGYLQKGLPEGFKSWDPHKRMKYIDECYVFGAKAFKEKPEAENEIRSINKKIYSREDETITLAYLQTREWSIEHQTDAFKKLGVIYDRQYPESEVSEDAVQIVKEHTGSIFIEDQGAIIFPGEQYGLNRWVFLTSDGIPTYEAKDLGLAYKKFQEYPELFLSLYETSVEQVAHFKAVFKALELIDPKFTGKLHHIAHGWMLRSDGKKFSSRMGETVKGMDIIQESIEYSLQKISETKDYSPEQAAVIAEKVAIAGLKFLILSHEVHKDFNYDPEQFLNPEGFSGPYLLYGYVRAQSILRQAGGETEFTIPEGVTFTPEESDLLRMLARYPNVTLDAGKNLAPHKLCNYLFELTQQFNLFYRNNKVLIDDEKTRAFRLALVAAVSTVLSNGLYILGIETVEQM